MLRIIFLFIGLMSFSILAQINSPVLLENEPEVLVLERTGHDDKKDYIYHVDVKTGVKYRVYFEGSGYFSDWHGTFVRHGSPRMFCDGKSNIKKVDGVQHLVFSKIKVCVTQDGEMMTFSRGMNIKFEDAKKRAQEIHAWIQKEKLKITPKAEVNQDEAPIADDWEDEDWGSLTEGSSTIKN